MKHGDWLFTCRMEPVQFDAWANEDHNDFMTLDGSGHSAAHCGLHPVSERYAHWFLDNKLYEYYRFFNASSVDSGAEWVRLGANAWYRVATNGVRYVYVDGYGKARQFSHLEYDAFAFFQQRRAVLRSIAIYGRFTPNM